MNAADVTRVVVHALEKHKGPLRVVSVFATQQHGHITVRTSDGEAFHVRITPPLNDDAK